MSAYVDSKAIGGAEGVSSLETAAVTVSGSDKVFIGGSVAGSFVGGVDTSSFLHGGAGGVSMTQLGVDENLITSAILGILTAWQAANPTDGSRTAYANFAAAAQSSAIVGACYSGVASIGTTQPNQQNLSSGADSFLDITTNLTGLTSGRRAVLLLATFNLSVSSTGFAAITGQGTLRDNAIGTLQTCGIALIDKVASGSTESLGARLNLSASGATVYVATIGFELVDASGGTDVLLGQAVM